MKINPNWKPMWSCDDTEGRIDDWLGMAVVFETMIEKGEFRNDPVEMLQTVMMMYASAKHLMYLVKNDLKEDKQKEDK